MCGFGVGIRVWCRYGAITPGWSPKRWVWSAKEGSYRASHRTAVYALCRQVGFGGHGSLSVRRARSTWLVAHLHAATSLAALRQIAGPVSGDTLTGLLTASASGLDPVDAAVGGLGA